MAMTMWPLETGVINAHMAPHQQIVVIRNAELGAYRFEAAQQINREHHDFTA
nr:hypothetical protein [Rhodoferax sp.]